MAHGRVVADGPTTEVKAMVGVHTIRATLPGVRADVLAALPSVIRAERHGETAILTCSDSDGRVLILLLAVPVILFLAIGAPNRDVTDFAETGISIPLYFMVGLAAFATMNAMLASGGRIAADRAAGWNRQLRVSPLSPLSYIGTKVLTGYLLAELSILVLYACGVALGVSLPANRRLEMTGLLLVGPAVGGLVAVLALLGGAWFRSAATASCTSWPRPCPPTGSCRPVTQASAKAAGASTAGS